MEYSIREVAEMTGVSTRTLRYYDEIGLLKPLYTNDSGYRYYGEEELNRLQQILFYKERGIRLQCILEILDKEEFDILGAFLCIAVCHDITGRLNAQTRKIRMCRCNAHCRFFLFFHLIFRNRKCEQCGIVVIHIITSTRF